MVLAGPPGPDRGASVAAGSHLFGCEPVVPAAFAPPWAQRVVPDLVSKESSIGLAPMFVRASLAETTEFAAVLVAAAMAQRIDSAPVLDQWATAQPVGSARVLVQKT